MMSESSPNDPGPSGSAGRQVSVLLVEDDPALQPMILNYFAENNIRTLVANNRQEMIDRLSETEVNLVILDLRLGPEDGLDLLREVRLSSEVPVIIITGHANVPLTVRAVREGALDVLEKPYTNERLIALVKSALEIAASRVIEASRREGLLRKLQSLSSRERDVMDLIVEGYSNKKVATALAISPRTVDIHRARVMEKLEAGSLAELVRMTVEIL